MVTTLLEPVRRVAMISLHTSPLEQPGTGDAGGMNVYVLELARRLAETGVEVDVFTRATASDQAPVEPAAPGVRVLHIAAGPFEELDKDDLPGQLCVFAREVLRAEADQPAGHYDVVHSHYWLSGQVGALARDRWGVPLVHTMHTMAKVKNAALAAGDRGEPDGRVIGEEQVVAAADALIANTDVEARQLVELYGASPDDVCVVAPGVDLSVFGPPAEPRATATRERLGLPADALVVLFAGRIQPLKGPQVLLRGVARLLELRPELRARLVVPVVGGPSGSGREHPAWLEDLAVELGIADAVRFVPPVSREELAAWLGAATLVAVPSFNESFGLVAAEAQACGTPVVAAAVGGLTTVVRDGVTGVLVPGHEPEQWASALGSVLGDPGLRDRLAAGAVEHAQGFAWERTAARTLAVYQDARTRMEVTA